MTISCNPPRTAVSPSAYARSRGRVPARARGLRTAVEVSAQSEGDAAPLDGRIGGSVGAFEAKYGKATNDPGTKFDAERAYANKNYRNLIALAVDGTISGVAFGADLDTTPEAERGDLDRRESNLTCQECSSRRMRIRKAGGGAGRRAAPRAMHERSSGRELGLAGL